MFCKVYFSVIFAFSFVVCGKCLGSADKGGFVCGVTEPVYNYTFDFTSLSSDLALTATSNLGDIFEFNICRNLTKTCNGQQDVSACMKRGKQEYILGTQQQLTYKSGKMFFTFTNGSKCKDNTLYQLNVILGCDYTMDKLQSQVTAYNENDCSFYILLETSAACLPAPDAVKSNLCTAKDPSTGHTYNLLPLSDSNHRVYDRNGSMFVINVCKPVLYGEAAMCPPGSSVCRVIDMNDTKDSDRFVNYGTVEANPIVENGQLLIRHKSDTPCNATHNYTSVIKFGCDRNIEYGSPDFMGKKGCMYEFSWLNAMSCNTIEPCVTYDPISGFKYNMNSLKNETYNLVLNGKNYTFGICTDAGSACLEHDGACESINGQSTSLGITNSNLLLNPTGSPYLLYITGASCQPKDKTATTTYWSTKIEFVCATDGAAGQTIVVGDGTSSASTASSSSSSSLSSSSSSGPKIIENSNCQLLIHYQTKLACQNQITCKTRGYGSATSVMDGNTSSDRHDMDLTPLISTTDNYQAEVSSSISQSEVGKSMKFYLNVCRPLVSKYGLGCPGGSAACMATVMGQSTPEEEQSLGYPDVALTRINETSAELKYRRGSPCPKDKSTQLSSIVQFTCDIHAGKGNPILKSIINDCHYQFIWPTNVICPAHWCQFDVNTCEIINDQLNERYSVRNASFTDKGKIKIPGAPEFNIDVCGDDHRKALTDYSQSTVKVFFNAPGPCTVDELVNVELRFVCGEKEDASASSDGDQCNLIYTQYTPEICKFLGLKIPRSTTTPSPVVGAPITTTTTTTTVVPATSITTTSSTASEEPSSGSFATKLVIVISVLSIVFGIGILLRTPQRREKLIRLFRKSSSAVRYSRVESNEEANLLLNQNGQFTDSDDDMLL
ncbi:cation-independent mannose-6-phosphate receptor [Eupeodes corollae]|uniref:cation-independent mannose-6-phosphate receptor n=1 Tax=Eupeodes corollae TaxID=290404 RepID=UPI002491D0FB|nr:cation-independent mannose-6-phosphate receptor [Eupeodes corollae]